MAAEIEVPAARTDVLKNTRNPHRRLISREVSEIALCCRCVSLRRADFQFTFDEFALKTDDFI